MTKKKSDNTLLLVAGGLLAAVAVGALVLGRRPTGDGASAPTETGSFWDKVPDFGIHNGLGFNGYGLLFDRWVNGVLPGQNPLPPQGEFGYYGPSFWEKYAAQYGSTTPPSTSSTGSGSSGFTPAGSGSGTGGSFGVSAGRYY